LFLLKTFKALNGLLCADVPLRNYSLTHSVWSVALTATTPSQMHAHIVRTCMYWDSGAYGWCGEVHTVELHCNCGCNLSHMHIGGNSLVWVPFNSVHTF